MYDRLRMCSREIKRQECLKLEARHRRRGEVKKKKQERNNKETQLSCIQVVWEYLSERLDC